VSRSGDIGAKYSLPDLAVLGAITGIEGFLGGPEI